MNKINPWAVTTIVLIVLISAYFAYIQTVSPSKNSLEMKAGNSIQMGKPSIADRTEMETSRGITTYTNKWARYSFEYPSNFKTIEHLDDPFAEPYRDPRMPVYDHVIICPPNAQTTVFRTGEGESCDTHIEIFSGVPTIEGGGGCDPELVSETELNGEMVVTCEKEDFIGTSYPKHPNGNSVVQVRAVGLGKNLSKEQAREIIKSFRFN